MLTILIGLLLLLALTLTSQDPPKKQEPQDTIKGAVRPADSLYIQQKITKMKLDSIYNEKKRK